MLRPLAIPRGCGEASSTLLLHLLPASSGTAPLTLWRHTAVPGLAGRCSAIVSWSSGIRDREGSTAFRTQSVARRRSHLTRPARTPYARDP